MNPQTEEAKRSRNIDLRRDFDHDRQEKLTGAGTPSHSQHQEDLL